MASEQTGTSTSCGRAPKTVFGIDLGTTYSAIAYHSPNGPVVVDMSSSARSLPSIVTVKGADTFEVGLPNEAFYAKHPSSIITNPKRLVGRDFTSLEKQVKLWPFKVVTGTNGAAEIMVGDKTYEPEVILSKILIKLVQKARSFTPCSEEIDAVLCVPADFDTVQKNAIRWTAKLAGINVLALINEPTAAVLACVNAPTFPTGSHRVVGIFDFGGGTFDVSIVRITKKTRAGGLRYGVLASVGNDNLGGIDIDAEVARWAEEEAKRTAIDFEMVELAEQLDTENHRFESRARLQRECEKAKIALTHDDTATIFVKNFFGTDVDLEVELSIEQFNLLAEKFVDKSIAAVREAFEYAQAKGEKVIHDIVLVGGTSHLRMLEPKLKKAFPSVQVVTSTDREFAVAKGAAIWAANLHMFAESHMEEEDCTQQKSGGRMIFDQVTPNARQSKPERFMLKTTSTPRLSELHSPQSSGTPTTSNAKYRKGGNEDASFAATQAAFQAQMMEGSGKSK